jgi:two-component system chemotaxis response regulator CheB
LMGVVLTGANQDGAAGVAAVVKAGGIAVVEDPASAYAPQMPGFALAACPTAAVTPLKEIASGLLTWGAA